MGLEISSWMFHIMQRDSIWFGSCLAVSQGHKKVPLSRTRGFSMFTLELVLSIYLISLGVRASLIKVSIYIYIFFLF